MFITSPYEYPQKILNYHIYKPTRTQTGSLYIIKVLSTVSSSSLRHLSVHQRKCLFRDESSLYTSKIYSRESCSLHCTYKNVMKRCNCSPEIFYNSGKNETFLHLMVVLMSLYIAIEFVTQMMCYRFEFRVLWSIKYETLGIEVLFIPTNLIYF